ncbi:hypothetical protein SG34_020120 [Thalassomonas viridans]|uniref:Uncharacterized protein n=1 Tax=Thalassomonas viridans TaxID=137584 RepID=A0AAE9YZ58_9GAMM|nr:hypothetical protein [Thalassomonas viridans]WDE03670.1 hypothetical protein SG34_020120 [Thalassomonas viridans]
MIKNFIKNEELGEVLWDFNGKKIEKKFRKRIQAELIADKNFVVVIANHKEVGNRNLFIYDEAGNIKSNPEMPKLTLPVEGVYSIWFVPGKEEQKVVLLTDENSPFDTACTFNLNTGVFSKFHRTN